MKGQLIPILFGAQQWLPSSESGLSFWYDPSNRSSFTPYAAIQLSSASSQYLTATSTLGGMDGNNRSFSCWIYMDSVAADCVLLVDGDSGATPAAGNFNFELKFLTATKNVQLKFCGYDSANVTTVTTSANSVTATATWYHVTWTIGFSGLTGSISVKVNGASEGTGTHTDSLGHAVATSQVFRIGSALVAGTYMNGRIDEVGYWTKQLSAGEVTTLYNSGTILQYPNVSGSLTTSLSSFWRLRETGATNRADSVGSLTLTAVNTPAATRSDAACQITDGDLIYQMNDLSGNGRHATQTTPGLAPTYKTAIQNGLPVVRYSAAGTTSFNITSGATYASYSFFVGFSTVLAASAQAFISGGNSSLAARVDGNNSLSTSNGVNTNGTVVGHTNPSSSTPTIWGATYTGGSKTNRMTMNGTNITTNPRFQIGANASVSAGTFTVSIDGFTSAAINYNSTAAQVQTAVHNLLTTAGYASPASLAGGGALPGANVNLDRLKPYTTSSFSIDTSGLTGGAFTLGQTWTAPSAATTAIGVFTPASPTAYFNGDMYEMFIYSSPLADGTHDRAAQYMRTKWGTA